MKSEPSGWPQRRLSDLVDGRGITYGVVQPGHPHPGGIPIVRVNNFTPDGLQLHSALQIDPDIERGYQRSRLRGGEVLITLVGTVGLVAIAPPAVSGWNVARAVGVIPVNDALVSHWVALSLQAPAAQRYLDARLNTTVQKTLNLRDLSAMELVVPPRMEMARICSVLNVLADKANVNGRLAARLEQAVLRQFRHEVIERAEGELVALPSIARFVNGRNFTKGASGTGRPVIRIRELSGGLNPSTVFTDASDVPANYVANFFDLLFAWSGTLGIHRWEGPEGLVNQHIFKVVPEDGLPLWFVESWLREHIQGFISIARDKATTMGHIRRGDLDRATVRVPSRLSELDARLGPLDALRKQALQESQRLLAIRRALLPRLMNGAIRLPDQLEPIGAISELLVQSEAAASGSSVGVAA